jgi:Zn finger protein HypA/HybF involved in hydrogenase expression
LLELGVQTEKLLEYFSSEITYNKKIKKLEKKIETMENNIQLQKKFYSRQFEKNAALTDANSIIKNKRIMMQCKKCKASVFIELETRTKYREMIERDLATTCLCKNCNFTNTYTPKEIMTQIGWSIVPED